MKKVLSIIAVLLTTITLHGQRNLSLKDGSLGNVRERTIPMRDVEETEDGIVVTYHLDNATIQPDPLYTDKFFVKIDGFGMNFGVAEPAYLFRWDTFSLPENTDYIVSVIDSTFCDFAAEIAPSRPLLSYEDTIGYTLDNVLPIKDYFGFYPSSTIPLVTSDNYRGTNLLRVKVTPVRYDQINHTIRICKELKYKIAFSTSVAKEDSRKSISKISHNDSFISNFALNKQNNRGEKASDRSAPVENDEELLIVTTSEFLSAAETLADWKRTLGFKVTIEAPYYWADTTAVWNAIHNRYINSDNLKYLILLGDSAYVPNYYKTISYHNPIKNTDTLKGYSTDLRYCVHGDNSSHIPEIALGRLSVSSSTEAFSVINKIIEYESCPPSYVHKGIHCSAFQFKSGPPISYNEKSRAVYTCEEIRNTLQNIYDKQINRVYAKYGTTRQPKYWNDDYYADGSELPEELLIYAWDGNTDDIINCINAGVHYALYIAHSDPYGWDRPSFTKNEINLLSTRTDNAFPIFFSMGCNTGKHPNVTCFAEALIKAENKGAIAVFANSCESLFGLAEALTEGMFFSIWPDNGLIPQFPSFIAPTYTPMPQPVYRLGDIMNQGVMRLWDTFPNEYYHQEILHLFGDPTMYFNTEIPTSFNDVSITWDWDSISVNLGGDDATITFLDTLNNNVSSYIGSSASFHGPTASIRLCISAHNKIPMILRSFDYDQYIQNETISNDRTYNARNVKIGTAVTNAKPQGAVVFTGGRSVVRAREVEIQGETTINAGAEIEINTDTGN